MRPEVSLFSSAHRPQNWLALYESIGKSIPHVELVFVGPNDPEFTLPENFHFIRSDVKPVQCFEIALRNCKAEHVMYVADDCVFVTTDPIVQLMKLYRSIDDSRCMISCRYMLNGDDQSDAAHHFFYGDTKTPVMPVSGFAAKRLFERIGGIDRNFIAVMWDQDIAMRIHQEGGAVVLSDVYINEDKKRSAGSMLCSEFWSHDRGLLEDLWMEDGELLQKRKRKVESFSDIGITIRSQGPRGRWRGSGPLVFEKIEDSAKVTWPRIRVFGRRIISLFLENLNRLRSPKKYPRYVKIIIYGKRNAREKNKNLNVVSNSDDE